MSCFYSTGDKVKVMDISRDGLRAVAEIVVDGGARRECHDANGADNGWTWCDFDLPENRLMVIRTVARDGAHGRNQILGNGVIANTSGR